MKKVKYLAMLLAAGMFAACSDNLEDTGAGNAGGTTPSTTDGYVKVSINTPTTSGTMTRATSLDDGTDNEYEVKNGILVFFKTTATTGTPEATAEFVKAYDVTLNYAGEGGSDNEVTTRHTVIGEAPMAGEKEQIYALAILNKGNLFQVNKNADENGGALQVKQNNSWADVFDSNNKTVAALQKALTVSASDITSKANGFLMLNAPLATTTTIADITDLSNVQTLVPVTVYDNEEAAQNGEAADIYVERVVAKITLKGFTYADNKYTAEVAKKDDNSPFKGDKVQLEGWTLSVTNKTTKAVRDISGLADWVGTTYSSDGQVRFLSTTKIDNQELYRIHWGIDCNYKSDDTYTDAFNILSETNKDRWTWEVNTNDKDAPNNESNPVYCLENTMDYNQMNQNQTTTLFIKTTYYADPSNPDNAQDFFMYGTQEETYLTNAFLTKVKEALSLTGPSPTISLDPAATGGTYTYVGSGEEAPTGKKDVKTLFTLTGGTSATLTDDQAKELISQLGEIKYYEDGATYYNSVLVRHFDDSYTDVVWDPATPKYTEKHLGRYGVLRNNWYEISITSISGPGNPEIEDPDPNPDDETEGYIQARINVLSWTKRTQNVEL